MQGMSATQPDKFGITPLHIAALHNRKLAFNWLLDHISRQSGSRSNNNASITNAVNATDMKKRTPLHYAVCHY
jgi:ankyrin repeat protein